MARIEPDTNEPFRMARYYDSLAMPDSALHWLNKVRPGALSPKAKIRYHLLMAGQLRQLDLRQEAWEHFDSVQMLYGASPQPADLLPEIVFLRGRLLLDLGEFPQAITNFDSAQALLREINPADTGLFLRILNSEGVTRYYQGDFPAALEVLKQGTKLAYSARKINPVDQSEILQNLAITFAEMSQFDSAYIYIEKAREIKEQAFAKDNPSLIVFYINYGRILQMTGRIEEGLRYLDLAEKLLVNKHGLEFVTGILYINLGNAYLLTADYERAIQYFQSAYSFFLQSRGPAHPRTLSVLNNLAFMYNRTSRPDSALVILNKLKDNNLIPTTAIRVHRNLAMSYRLLKKFDLALRSISTSIETAENLLGSAHYEYAYSLLEKANIYIAEGNFHQALESISAAEAAYAGIFPVTDEEYINILRLKAFIYSRLLQFGESEKLFFRAESLLSQTTPGATVNDTMAVRRESFIKGALLIDKARMYQEWYAHSGDITRLRSGVELYSRSLRNYEQYIQFATDESRLLLGDDMRGTYDDALRAAWDLYALTGEKDKLELAFGFASRTKSSVLLASIRKLQAFEAAGVPTETTQLERSLRREIHALTRAAADERLNPEPNNMRIAFLNARRVAMTRTYDSLMQQIEVNYPDYFALRYAPATLSTAQVQDNLGPDQALVEYFIESNNLYIFALRKDSLLVMRNETGIWLEQRVDSLRTIILSNLMNHTLDDYRAFLELSTSLYNELILPVESFIKGHRLVVVPDGVLGYLPFDLLIKPEHLTDDHRQQLDYAGLPLMLHDYPLSYLSSTALTSAFKSGQGQKTGRMLALAPDYSNDALAVNQQYPPLPYAKKEAETVRKIWGGVLLEGGEATKSAFIQTAPRYGLLHLAMHTMLDDENPLYSRLIFQPDSTAMNEMQGYELYALKLNAAMVVLSACNTGVGKLRSAEGVMSLSRAFMYAGVPAVVMTGWEVNDQSGSRLMELFYQNLALGLAKDVALQQAKLTWLQEANKLKAHPFFWAAYQVLGNTQPLRIGWPKEILISTFVVSALIVFFIWRRVRRKRTFVLPN
ncbi:MAG: CHAT domain-containing protein [Bacteroidetes bacterium]|nr:CHAT domain-containing protein [Bacteroidota bacterium]